MRQSSLYRRLLSVFLAIGAIPSLSSCDTSEPEKTAEEGEGLEAVQEAMKKEEEEKEKEGEARKERGEEKALKAEGAMKASPGMKRR